MTVKQAKILWITAIVAMGLTVAMNLFGGTGTVCAAYLTKNFPPMWQDLKYHRWLYQRLMIMTIIIGVAGLWVLYALFRSKQHCYRYAVALLVMGTFIAELQVTASLDLRGKAVPANIKFYFNLFTLIYFLILGLPTISQWVDFSKPGGKTEMAAAGGMTAILAGLAAITINVWVGDSHIYMGTDWVNVLQPELGIGGIALTILGMRILARSVSDILRQSEQFAAPIGELSN
jgi:hypothetical protein